jgi:hypothetical protein
MADLPGLYQGFFVLTLIPALNFGLDGDGLGLWRSARAAAKETCEKGRGPPPIALTAHGECGVLLAREAAMTAGRQGAASLMLRPGYLPSASATGFIGALA